MRSRNRKHAWTQWVGILAVLAFGTWAWADTLPFECDSSGALYFYDQWTGEWLPAKVTESGDVVFESDGQWWTTGYSKDELAAGGLTCGGGGQSPGERMERETGRMHAMRQGRRAAADYTHITVKKGGDEYEPLWDVGVSTPTSVGRLSSEDTPPAEIPEWQVSWGISGTYRSDDFDVLSGGAAAGKTRTRSQTLRMTALHEDWRVESSLTYDRVDPDSALGDLAFDRLSLQVTPMYSLLEQAADGFDLALITSAAVSRSWFESGTGVDDPMHVFGAAGLGVGRTFSFGDLRLAGMYAAQKNTSGDEEVTGKGTIPMRILSGAYTVGFTRNWTGLLGVDYIHTGDLPSAYDSNEYYGTASVQYRAEKWAASLAVTRSIHNDNQRSWSATGSLTFRW